MDSPRTEEYTIKRKARKHNKEDKLNKSLKSSISKKLWEILEDKIN